MSQASGRDIPQGNELNAQGERFRRDMHEVLDEARGICPVLRDDAFGRWFVTSYEAAREIYRDKKGCSRDWAAHAADGTWGKIVAPQIGKWGMVDEDGDEHRRLRGLVSKAFTPQAVDALRPRMVEVADDLIEAMKGRGRFEFIEQFAAPMPTIIMAEMLGVEKNDQATFKRWSEELIQIVNPTISEKTFRVALEAKASLEDYFARAIRERREAPKGDLISGLVQAQEADQRLTETEIVTTCVVLIVGGNITTTDLMGNGLVALLKSPAQMDKLRTRPELLEAAVEEMLRFDGPATEIPRFCTTDVEFEGVQVGKGQTLTLSLVGCNHDPRSFARPHVFDIERKGPVHQAFGGGSHYCLGAPLARAETQVAFARLLAAFPRLTLMEQPLQKKAVPTLNGYESVWVSHE